ncbi:MAG: hypothetical protein JSS09_00025 [Verrucomicrobia bacterium]|nr:hypothetical protein [Verrucomicrobiota bacterium]
MNRSKIRPLRTMHALFQRIMRNFLIGFGIVAVCLGLGICGYRYFEGMDLVTAYENAAMILSGMGPVDTLKTEGGKIFAGSYALFSGIVFLVVIAIIIAPVFHHFLHKFIINQTK